MIFRLSSSSLLLAIGLFLAPISSLSAEETSASYKVLASQKAGLNLYTVNSFIEKGDQAVSNQDLDQARKHFDKAEFYQNNCLVSIETLMELLEELMREFLVKWIQKGERHRLCLLKQIFVWLLYLGNRTNLKLLFLCS